MKKVLIITYYWPPSGGSGVQRWMYFCKYLKDFGIEPIVITVDEKKASYRNLDFSFCELVEDIEVYKTNTLEPLKFYSKIMSGDKMLQFLQHLQVNLNLTIFKKLVVSFGNFFLPDARIGWVKYAVRMAKNVIANNDISYLITTGPPHSTHLIGLKLKKYFSIPWMTDFRDSWTALHYNNFLYRTKSAKLRVLSLKKKFYLKQIWC